VERVSRSNLGQELLSRLQERLAALLEGGHLAPRERAEAGDVLGKLGDPRPGVGLLTSPLQASGATMDGAGIPEIAWCTVPEGEFLMGTDQGDEQAWSDEHPQHRLTLPTFEISRYPITNVQYGAFVQAGGYNEPGYWTEEGWGWRKGEWEAGFSSIEDEEPRRSWEPWLAGRPVERRDRPFYWEDPAWNLPNRPLVGVSWYEALAFCAWLQERLQAAVGPDSRPPLPSGHVVRLPTEAEWEKAARGTDGLRWPWGSEWREGQANTSEMGLGSTSPVGCFPGGASPCGALDMAGNVWEWTASKWDQGGARPEYGYPYDPTDGRDDTAGPHRRVVRGGSWLNLERDARCATRRRLIPDYFFISLGFRVVVSLALSES